MATAKRVASIRLQALRAEAIAEQRQAPAKPLASWFSVSGKATRKSRAAAKPVV